jgi:TonB family protein
MSRPVRRAAIILATAALSSSVTPAVASEAFERQAERLLASVGAEPAVCPESVSARFRPTVQRECASIGEEYKPFRQRWARVADRLLADASLTSWFRSDKGRRDRYYWVDNAPLLVQYDLQERLLVLARYDVSQVCRERAKQQGIEFLGAEEQARGGSAPRLKGRVQPVFPDRGRMAGHSAVVLLWFVVDDGGGVSKLCLIEAVPRGHGFELAAMDAVERWRYEPAKSSAGAVAAEVLTRITFESGTAPLPYRELLDRFFAAP